MNDLKAMKTNIFKLKVFKLEFKYISGLYILS